MNEAEMKLSIFRAIDQLKGDTLGEIYHLVQNLLDTGELDTSISGVEDVEIGYKAMSGDEERESEALSWIEGTLNPNDL